MFYIESRPKEINYFFLHYAEGMVGDIKQFPVTELDDPGSDIVQIRWLLCLHLLQLLEHRFLRKSEAAEPVQF